MKFGDVKRQG